MARECLKFAFFNLDVFWCGWMGLSLTSSILQDGFGGASDGAPRTASCGARYLTSDWGLKKRLEDLENDSERLRAQLLSTSDSLAHLSQLVMEDFG